MKENVMVCLPKRLPLEKTVDAARTAVAINPMNYAPVHRLARVMADFKPTPDRLAVLVKKYWGTQGVKLTVSFTDAAPAGLRKKILSHMNAWSKTANVKFVETQKGGQVRIAREGGDRGGYWSYLGTDILHIDPKEPTMNLEAFSMATPESEFIRVVRHETGHTLGFPHEHMRGVLVDKIDREKAIAFFMETQGWTRQEVINQVLTPIEESSLRGTKPDGKSIMCYQIPGNLTKDGKPIIGGLDINDLDYAFAGGIYPKKIGAPQLPPAVAKKTPLKAKAAIR